MLTKPSVVSNSLEIRGKDNRLAIALIIKKHLKGTPMEGLENKFTECGIDPLLLTAIGYEESRLGLAYSQEFNNLHHNPFGIMAEGLKIFASWEDSISETCQIITKISGRGATNLSMLGAVYTSSPSWSNKVGRIYNQLWSELETL